MRPIPIDAMSVAESDRTGNASTRRFQTFVFGKIWQPGAPTTGFASALSVEPASSAKIARTSAIRSSVDARRRRSERAVIARS